MIVLKWAHCLEKVDKIDRSVGFMLPSHNLIGQGHVSPGQVPRLGDV